MATSPEYYQEPEPLLPPGDPIPLRREIGTTKLASGEEVKRIAHRGWIPFLDNVPEASNLTAGLPKDLPLGEVH